MTQPSTDEILTPVEAELLLARFYEPGTALSVLLLKHSRSVADKAAEINSRKALGLNEDMVRAAALLHDIGIFLTDAPGIHCHGPEPYIRHGVLGAALLREAGAPEWAARVAERHTGAGITAAEIAEKHLPLPPMDLVPETLLEKLICYADKFYSKSGDMQQKSIERIRASISRHFPESLERFETLHILFA